MSNKRFIAHVDQGKVYIYIHNVCNFLKAEELLEKKLVDGLNPFIGTRDAWNGNKPPKIIRKIAQMSLFSTKVTSYW